ncbi:hypothetical protein GW7_09749 [Heterocephalus glaber]|uniref:DNA endonuclease Ctp1 N-terminal domain-containing protein n=1 Tax=Heterocephalus glaber TaxID=10181 RepID=G5C8E9_HETGA|nr:hypothetical protein GW7_09749 [Heterocephalus glaber]
METFMESLNKLKDTHEKEVLGLQNKLLELNSERCRDAQRVEELFAKNHQLREQQKALKENLRVLENRLRAGLCDRCMVTQEVARKRQLEFESSHLQSLQRICVLTNEMTKLKEENKMLKEEVKRLCGLEEGTLERPSPLLLPSPGGRKAVTEKPHGGHEEAEEEQQATASPGEDKSAGYRTSPVVNPPESRAPDMSPQRISNQLHATVAVVRPGSRACLADRGSSDRTSPPTRSTPSSPVYEHSLPLDSFLRASGPAVRAYESLKRPLQTDHFCLLDRHLSLHLQSPHNSPPALAPAPHSPQPWVLKAGEAWEEPVGLLGLPGALVGMQDPRLEGVLHLLLAQRQLCARARAGSDTLRGPPPMGGTPPSPPVGWDSDSPEHEVLGAALTTAALPGGRHPQTAGSSPQKEAGGTQDYAPDKPLDLSDPGRSKDAPKSASQAESLSSKLACPLSPEPLTLSRALTHSPPTLSNGTQGPTEPEPEGSPTPTGPSPPLPGPPLSLLTAIGTRCEARGRSRPAPHPQGPKAAGPPEPSKAGAHSLGSGELEESDTSNSEVDRSSETGAKLSMPGEEHRRFCPQKPQQGLQQKRKQTLDLASRGSKKLCRGRRKARELMIAAEGPNSPRDTKDCSPSPGNSSPEET